MTVREYVTLVAQWHGGRSTLRSKRPYVGMDMLSSQIIEKMDVPDE